MIRPSIKTHLSATTISFHKLSASPVASGTMPVPTSAMPTSFAKLGKTETASATHASTSHLRPSYASNKASSMSPLISVVKLKPSAELITDMYQALTPVNTLLPLFRFARNVANFTIQLARHARLELTVVVNNTNHRLTRA